MAKLVLFLQTDVQTREKLTSRSSYHAHQAVPRGSRDGEPVNMRRATTAHEVGNKCPN